MSEMEPGHPTSGRELFLGAILILVVGAAIMLTAWAMRLHAREQALRGAAPPRLPALTAGRREGMAVRPGLRAPAREQPSAPTQTKTEWDVSAFEHVQRLIELEHDRDVAAITTAKLRLEEKFRSYSARVPQFVEALNSLPEKARLAKTLLEDKSESDNQTQEEAARLFAENVVPPDKLRDDVMSVVAGFEGDVEANRKMVLSAAAPAFDLSNASAPLAAANADALLADFSGQLSRFLRSQAEQVPTSSVNSLARSVLVEEALRKKVAATMEANNLKRERAAIVGTAVGVLAAAADYWLLQSRFEDALTRRCQTALDKIEAALWSNPQNGLEASFTRYVDLVHETEVLALKRAAGK
jgi:hypothetical protein